MALEPGEAIAPRKRRIRDDWLEPLPAARHQLFGTQIAEMEAVHDMGCVSLNEAFAFRRKGCLIRARQHISMTADLLDRLTEHLVAALSAVEEEARGLESSLTVAPLNPEFFRGEMAVRAAWWNSLVHGLLVFPRLRLSHKLWTMKKTALRLRRDFRAAANEIIEGTSTDPSATWELVEELHFDLTTLLRETTVLLKSFLLALSTDGFESFQRRLARQTRLPAKPGFTGAST